MSTSTDIKVPRLLWESLQAVLEAQGKKYVREMAKALEVDPRDLVKKVFDGKDGVRVILHDTATDSLECAAYVQDKAVTRMCRRPVQLGSEFCSHHIVSRPHVAATAETAEIRKLQDDPARPSLWVHPDGRAVDIHGKVQGFYNTDTGALTLLQIEGDLL
jgi:hypothetical protein